MVIDVTQWNRTESERLKTAQWWQNTFDAISDIVCIISRDLEFQAINEAGVRALGISREEIIGRKCYELVHRAQGPIPACPCTATLKTGAEGSNEYEQDGRYYSLRALPIRDQSGHIDSFFHIVQDITERKRAAETLRNSSRRILSIREEEKKKISENIHREVGYITGALNLLADSVEKKIRSRNLEAALEASWKFKSTFHDFIFNIRRLALELRPPDLDILGFTSAVSHYLSNIEKATGLKIELHSNVDEKKMGDDLSIIFFSIVQEAVNNILKHSHANRARVSLQSHRRRISLAIKDNGRGFAPKEDKKGAESGMGLRLIKEMIESLEGTFEIHPSPGKGTRLLVSLPVEKPAERDSGLQAEAAGEAAPAAESEPKPDPHGAKGKG